MVRIAYFTPLIAALALSSSVWGQTPAHPDQIEFNFKYRPGRVTTQRIVSRNVGSMVLPPPMPEQKMSQTVEETITSRCLSVNPDGSGEFEMKIDGLALKMSIGPLNLTYDSKTYDPHAKADFLTGFIARIFNAMNGATFNATLSPTGRALKMQGLSAVLKRMVATIASEPGGKDNALLKSMADQLTSSMDDNAFGQELQSLFRMVPSKPGPYKIGDKWSNSWEMKMMGMAMTGRGEYQLVGIETYRGYPCAKIRTKESMEVAKAPPDSTTNKSKSAFAAILDRMDIRMTSNDGQGVSYIDYQTGVLVSMKATQNIDMVMSMKADPQAKNRNEQQGFTMSESFRTSVSADLVETPAAQSGTVPDLRGPAEAATKPAGIDPAGSR